MAWQQPGWQLADSLLPSLIGVHPLRGDHQGGTLISIFGAGFAWNGTDVSSMRCCWDHHAGHAPTREIGSYTAYPDRTATLVLGGDGEADVESAVISVNDSVVVCRSYSSVPGYEHTDNLLLSFRPTCAAGALLDTRGDFQFVIDERMMQLVSVVPRGGPVAGGTPVVIRGPPGFGGRWLRCRFGEYTNDATYDDRTQLRCITPAVHQPGAVNLEVTPDGAGSDGDGSEPRWTLPLNFTFYDVTEPRVSSVWPLGGPGSGFGVLTIRGSGFVDYSGGVEGGGEAGRGLGVGLGSGAGVTWLRTHVINESTLLAWTRNNSNVTAVRGSRVTLEGGGYDDGGMAPLSQPGQEVRVSLNGGQRPEEDLLRGIGVEYRFYPADQLRVSEIFPYGAHHAGGTDWEAGEAEFWCQKQRCEHSEQHNHCLSHFSASVQC